MNINKVTFFSAVLMAGLILFQSCKKKEEDDPAPTQFVASNTTFKDFRTWNQIGTVVGTNTKAAPYHLASFSDATRLIYLRNDQDTIKGGKYPMGTLLVMQSYNIDKSIQEFVGLAKRGGSFNPGMNDWEWFKLNSKGTIATDSTGAIARGAFLDNSACGNCHVNANVDFVYTKY